MRITRLRVTNYRGVSAIDATVAERGMIASGKNMGGKTSILKSIRAALDAQDISSDAIRLGEQRAEILVDLENVTVQRVITSKGSTLKVTRDGMIAQKPQHFLGEILGLSTLDPLDLYLAKPKERRAKILEALPVRVTVEQLKKWAPVPDNFDCSGHGLEVLARVHKTFYDQRTEQNKAADAASEEAHRLAAEAERLGKAAPPAVGSVAEADAELVSARGAAAVLADRANNAEATRKRQNGARDRIQANRNIARDQRSEADQVEAGVDEDALRKVADGLAAEVNALQQQLTEKRAQYTVAMETYNAACGKVDKAEALRKSAAELERAATESEAMLDESIVDVTEDEALAAEKRVIAAQQGVAAAQARHAAVIAGNIALSAAAKAKAEADIAKRLDDIVRALDRSPGELLATADAIPGLAISGEDIILDGVRLEARSGAEQLAFAVAIAKRLNAKAKILVVDGLERLDSEGMAAFLKLATADSWQVIASRVADGEVVLEAIEDDSGPASGERASVDA